MGCLFSNATRLELEFFCPMADSEESESISSFFFPAESCKIIGIFLYFL